MAASRLQRRQSGEPPQLQRRLKSRLGCSREPLSRRFHTTPASAVLLPRGLGPSLETRPLWSPLNETNTNREARSTPRSYQEGPAEQTTHLLRQCARRCSGTARWIWACAPSGDDLGSVGAEARGRRHNKMVVYVPAASVHCQEGRPVVLGHCRTRSDPTQQIISS